MIEDGVRVRVPRWQDDVEHVTCNAGCGRPIALLVEVGPGNLITQIRLCKSCALDLRHGLGIARRVCQPERPLPPKPTPDEIQVKENLAREAWLKKLRRRK